MLLKFKVGNFRSFGEIQELSMACGSTHSQPDHITNISGVKLLKDAAIYGANAGGKTSFVRAMEVSKQMILFQTNSVPGSGRMYCRTDSSNKNKPTYFEYILEISGKFYSYGFEIVLASSTIESEWLSEINPEKNSDERIIFQRPIDGDGFKFGEDFDKNDRSRLKVYSSDLYDRNDVLFLGEMSRKNFGNNPHLKIFHEVFRWFRDKLLINSTLALDRNSISNAGKIMSALDTDISDLGLREVNQKELQVMDPIILANAENVLRNNLIRGGPKTLISPDWTYFELSGEDDRLTAFKPYSSHHSSKSRFEIEEESSGTVQALRLVTMFNQKLDGITYVQDEFGNNMHPNMAYEFVKLFQKYNSGRSNQLIITTHQINLMTLDIYRRDEIWFIEKKSGESRMYSLEDFRERFDKKLSKAYLEGRYGALPVFDENIVSYLQI